MENIYDLEEYSSRDENSGTSEELKDNSPQKDSDILISSFSDYYPNLDSSPDKQELSGGKITISKNHSINGISNNPINISTLKINNNYNDSNLQICEQNSYLENNIKSVKKSLNEFAVEDNIDESEFEKIKEPAMNFSFSLDKFQKRSIIRLEQNKNILVCAHTSSGKTLVAEYGIALGKKNNKKVIYTSPIKALSNQKYCEFKKKFGDVGIITGDVNINSNAQCLVITTEILHKFLYSQSDTLSNVGTVIFDEVHYINDNERGHIWEEILIVLPHNISIIMLSATIPNYFEFAGWVGKIKNTKVYIEVTKNRVVPLQYFIYIDADHVFKVKNKEEIIDNKEIDNAFDYLKRIKAPKFNENNDLNLNLKNNNYNNEIKNNSDNENENIIKEEPLSSNSEIDENEGNEINDDENNNDEEGNDENNENYNKFYDEKPYKKNTKKKILEIVKYLLNNKLFPATLFVFNIRKIQEYSSMLFKNNNFQELPKQDKEKINNFFDKTISVIPTEEQKIPQIKYIKQILQYGIGVHHSGLLPILKEIIEILYFHGLIKILFATTSFSIGLNMPTRTVVFTSLHKYHEGKIQMLNSSEFLQMCGRAGRRGIDEFGNVFILYTHPQGKREIKRLKGILIDQGNDLESKFRLSYRIILSFYLRNLKNIKDFFKESFHESHNIERKPERIKEIHKLESEIENKHKIKCLYNKKNEKHENLFCDIEDSPIATLIRTINKYDSFNKKIYNNEKIIDYLNINPGTILKIKLNSKTSINKFNKSDLVMLINVITSKDKKKLWCLAISSHEDNKNKNNNSNSNSNSNCNSANKEDELKQNEKEKEKDKNNLIALKNKGKYKEYKYKYLIINLNDIIEIYEKPKVNIDQYYKQDKINNFFDINDKGCYFFKNNNKCLYNALKLFYRVIINNFPKKTNDIQAMKKTKNKKNNNEEKKTVKVLDCEKIIGKNEEYKDIFQKKKQLKELINNNCCIRCPYYQYDLYNYKEICEIKDKINEIRNEIEKGEEKETYKLFNKRLDLLKDLDYIKINNNENIIDNSGNINIEENKYEKYSLTLKGKASLEIITNDSILISELLLSNIFIHKDSILSAEIIVPFLASFVNNSKIKDLKTEITLDDNKKNDEEVKYLMGEFHKIYNELAEKEKNYELQESVYNRSFSFKYFYPVYTWMKGNNFCDACIKHQIVEGKLYTFIMRTYYFVEEIFNFYIKIGNQRLANTFLNIKNNLLKGIMSVESLYLKDDINIDHI